MKYIISLNDSNVTRLCKLLNQCYFNNCLSKYLNINGEKIGEGGFGSVFKVILSSLSDINKDLESKDNTNTAIGNDCY